jgi:hypothetical protein
MNYAVLQSYYDFNSSKNTRQGFEDTGSDLF